MGDSLQKEILQTSYKAPVDQLLSCRVWVATIQGTPSALVVHPDGTVGSPVAGGAEAIRSLVQQAVEAPSPNAPLLLPGAPASTHNNGKGGPCPKCGKEGDRFDEALGSGRSCALCRKRLQVSLAVGAFLTAGSVSAAFSGVATQLWPGQERTAHSNVPFSRCALTSR